MSAIFVKNHLALAPIILFAYNRPQHAKRTLDALAANQLASGSDIFIFIDGPKSTADAVTRQAIAEVQKLAHLENRFATTTVIVSETNQGLAQAVISGVTSTLNRSGKAIILEDDLISSTTFLRFMNDALDRYETADNVSCISGYVYPISEPLPSTYFIKGADCWGWATWKRAWDLFEPDGKKLYAELKRKNLTHQFDFAGTFPYSRMLEDQIAGRNSSWAVRWYASAFLKDMLTLYPAKSFIHNIGIDGSGTHSGRHNYWHIDKLATEYQFADGEITESNPARESFARYFKQLGRKSVTRRLRQIAKAILGRFGSLTARTN